MKYLGLLGAVALAGCAVDNPATPSMMLTAGQLSIAPAPPGAAYDYQLTFMNLREIGNVWDLDRRPDREVFVATALRDQCARTFILDEGRIATGAPLGRELANWTVYVDCQR